MKRAGRAEVARAFADWVDDTREGRRAGWRAAAEEGLSASERRELRAAIRDAEMIRGWVALMLAGFGGEVRRDIWVPARPMDGVR